MWLIPDFVFLILFWIIVIYAFEIWNFNIYHLINSIEHSRYMNIL